MAEIDSANIASSIGTGQAQVLRPDLSYLRQAQANALGRIKQHEAKKLAEKKAKDKKFDDELKYLANVKYNGAMQKHIPIIRDEAIALYDDLVKNREKYASDVNYQSEFNNRLQKFVGATNTSIQGNKDLQDLDKLNIENKDLRNDSREAIKNHRFDIGKGTIDDVYATSVFDPNQLKQNININQYLTKNVLPMAEQYAKGLPIEFTDPSDPSKTITVTKNKLEQGTAQDLIKNALAHSPQLTEQAEYDLSQDEKAKGQYQSGIDYWADKFGIPMSEGLTKSGQKMEGRADDSGYKGQGYDNGKYVFIPTTKFNGIPIPKAITATDLHPTGKTEEKIKINDYVRDDRGKPIKFKWSEKAKAYIPPDYPGYDEIADEGEEITIGDFIPKTIFNEEADMSNMMIAGIDDAGKSIIIPASTGESNYNQVSAHTGEDLISSVGKAHKTGGYETGKRYSKGNAPQPKKNSSGVKWK